jgi:hypothetical protein
MSGLARVAPALARGFDGSFAVAVEDIGAARIRLQIAGFDPVGWPSARPSLHVVSTCINWRTGCRFHIGTAKPNC